MDCVKVAVFLAASHLIPSFSPGIETPHGNASNPFRSSQRGMGANPAKHAVLLMAPQFSENTLAEGMGMPCQLKGQGNSKTNTY